MTNLLRQEIATAAHTLVIKVGTRVLTHNDGTLNHQRIVILAEELSILKSQGRNVVLVSSGAVGAGMHQLQIHQRPTDLAQLQAVAAVGQAKLTQIYDQCFKSHGQHAAQVLLTAEDLDDRARYLNIRNTLVSLFDYSVIPIINENDTVSVEELKTTFGDNDRLAARVTNLVQAPLLIILSDVAGLYSGPPEESGSEIISVVQQIDDQLLRCVQDKKTGHSKGGMRSKIEAARLVTSAGENLVIASGREEGILRKIMEGEDTGTLFLAQGRSISPRKRWIGYSVEPRGSLIVDEGASRALLIKGKSLLPIGITAVKQSFIKGDIVSVCDQNGNEIARGLTNYDHQEVNQILGKQTTQIAEILGYHPYDEVIHRDNLTINEARGS